MARFTIPAMGGGIAMRDIDGDTAPENGFGQGGNSLGLSLIARFVALLTPFLFVPEKQRQRLDTDQ
jgi:hypothetical protein